MTLFTSRYNDVLCAAETLIERLLETGDYFLLMYLRMFSHVYFVL